MQGLLVLAAIAVVGPLLVRALLEVAKRADNKASKNASIAHR